MCIVCIAFTRASSKSVLSKASTVFEEVNAPSAHGAECQTFSPLRTLCDAKSVIKPMSKMSNLCLNRFSGSPVFAPFSASNLSAHERISVASGRSACHCFWQFSQYGGERGKSHIRSLSQFFAHSITSQNHVRSHATTSYDAVFES